MASGHEAAVRAALRTGEELGRLFARIGTSEHPRGQILSAYRTARGALRGNLGNRLAVEDALGTLRLAVNRAASDILRQAADVGATQAAEELAAYGLPGPSGSVGAQTLDALQTIMSALETQLQAVRSISLAGMGEALAIGDATRAGVLTPGPVTREAGLWAAITALLEHDQAVASGVKQAGAEEEFLRQAIAAIDERTTQTCLLVHGQTTTLNGDFKLSGTPRFADKMHASPFHYWCRTGIGLVKKRDADDELSREMREAARAELQAREETGTTVEIHPAHATSGRAS